MQILEDFFEGFSTAIYSGPSAALRLGNSLSKTRLLLWNIGETKAKSSFDSYISAYSEGQDLMLFYRGERGSRICRLYTRTIYKHKVDVDVLNAVKSVLADFSSISSSSEQRSKEALLWRRANARNVTHSLRRSAYSHQPYVDRLYVLPPRRRRPKLVLTGTSIPLYIQSMCRCKEESFQHFIQGYQIRDF